MKKRTNLILKLLKGQRPLILCLMLFCWFFTGKAQTLPGTYTTSWAGNIFAPSSSNYNFMQGWANSMFVDTDGTVYSNAYWDEGAKEAGIYKNGQCTGWIQNQHTSVIAGEYVSLLISGLAKEFLLGVNETP